MRSKKAEQVAAILKAAVDANAPAERGEAFAVLRKKLPPGVPHELVSRFWAEQMTFPAAHHRLRATPDEYIDAVLAGLRAWRSPAAAFLVASVVDDPTPQSLREANRAFAVIANHPSPYSPKGRADVRAVLARPSYLAGTHAAVAAYGWQDDAYSFARALIFEGSDPSIDVLLPWIRRVVTSGNAAPTALIGLTRFAETPGMRALLAELPDRP